MGLDRTKRERLERLLPDPYQIPDGYVITTQQTLDDQGNPQGGYVLAPGGGGSVTGVTATAPIASSGGTAPVISLNNSAVTPGSYTNTNLTVDAHGLITAASNGSASGTVTSVGVTINGSGTGVTGSPITTSGVIDLTIPTGVTVAQVRNIAALRAY